MPSKYESAGDRPWLSPGSGWFHNSASHLSGLIPALTGWTPGRFWSATPAELAAIFTAYADAGSVHENNLPLGSAEAQKLKEQHPDG